MVPAISPDPWRHERRLLQFGLPALAGLGTFGFPYIGRDALHWFPLFLLWAGWLVGVPTWVLARRIGSASPLERLGFGSTLAIVGLALFQFAVLELGVRDWVLAYPLAVLAVSVVLKHCRTKELAIPPHPPFSLRSTVDLPLRGGGGCCWWMKWLKFSPTLHLPPGGGGRSNEVRAGGGDFVNCVEPMPRIALTGAILAFAMALGVMAVLPSFFPAKVPVLNEQRKSRLLKLLPDILLHLQAQEEMSHTWPPQFSPAAGVQLRYHLAADAITLALTPPGVPRLAVNCHAMPAFWHLLMAGNALLLARRYLGATWLAGLFPILAVFGEDFGWLVPKLELPMVPSLPTFPSFFWYNPNLPGMAVLMGGLAALGWATGRHGRRCIAECAAGHDDSTAIPPPAVVAARQSTTSPQRGEVKSAIEFQPSLSNNHTHHPLSGGGRRWPLAATAGGGGFPITPNLALIWVPAVLLGGAALFKVFIGVQAGLAVAFALVLCGAGSRRTLFQILMGLALFGAMMAFLYRHTFEAPNQHLRIETLAEMRMSYWFIPVILGFRILGLSELIRISMRAIREGPLRVAVVGLVLTGAIGLFVRISAMLTPGVLGYNNGVWLAVVAKVPMWLLVLGAIQRWQLRPSSKVALALLITVVAVRGAWPFVKFQCESSEVATPPHLITPDDLEIPRWLKQSVPPGTIVACDPTFPLSLTALSPYRTPCPQVGEFAYAISFMTSQDHAQRVMDAKQFWDEWSCGGLPREYLKKYRVRWIITRSDLGCPDGQVAVFRNGSWAIYEGYSASGAELAMW